MYGPLRGCRHQFMHWCRGVLPTVYSDALSYGEDVSKAYALIKQLAEEHNVNAEAITELQQLYDSLLGDFEDFKSGKYDDFYEQSLMDWFENNLRRLIENSFDFVWAGIDDDGYFTVYVPDNWDMLGFDTVMDYDDPNYGCLVATWDSTVKE